MSTLGHDNVLTGKASGWWCMRYNKWSHTPPIKWVSWSDMILCDTSFWESKHFHRLSYCSADWALHQRRSTHGWNMWQSLWEKTAVTPWWKSPNIGNLNNVAVGLFKGLCHNRGSALFVIAGRLLSVVDRSLLKNMDSCYQTW